MDFFTLSPCRHPISRPRTGASCWRRDRAEPGADDALASLCDLYWYPLYAYVRRRGHGADEAHDLTQEFFARLLEKDFLADVDRSKGKFRSFLLAACKHFLANERDRARREKRGGGRPVLSLDAADAEGAIAPSRPTA